MHEVIVKSRRASRSKLEAEYPGAAVVDVTSRARDPWVRFSPFFPHGGIPVPFSDRTAESVEGIWQALKVFETADVDPRKHVTSMRGLKRTVRKYGKCLGHRRGLSGDELLGYVEARKQIYLPIYAWVLEHRLADEVAKLRAIATERDLVLLDYETNTNVDDPRKPLSHAGLVAKALGTVRATPAPCES